MVPKRPGKLVVLSFFVGKRGQVFFSKHASNTKDLDQQSGKIACVNTNSVEISLILGNVIQPVCVCWKVCQMFIFRLVNHLEQKLPTHIMPKRKHPIQPPRNAWVWKALKIKQIKLHTPWSLTCFTAVFVSWASETSGDSIPNLEQLPSFSS